MMMDVVYDLPFPRCLGFLDGESLFVASLVSWSSRRTVEEHAFEFALERRVGSAHATRDVPKLLLDVLRRMEAAVVWESFEAGFEGWTPCPTNGVKYERLCTVDGALCLSGGGEMNFTGLRFDLPRDCRPRRVSFRYNATRPGTRRGFANVFLARELSQPSRWFRVGDPSVFSFLLPLREGDRAQLWVPQDHRVFVFDQPPPNTWRLVEMLLDWELDSSGSPSADVSDTLWLKIKVQGDGVTDGVSDPFSLRLPENYRGFNFIYLFNWLEEGDDLERDDAPELCLSDLVIELLDAPDPDFRSEIRTTPEDNFPDLT